MLSVIGKNETYEVLTAVRSLVSIILICTASFCFPFFRAQIYTVSTKKQSQLLFSLVSLSCSETL